MKKETRGGKRPGAGRPRSLEPPANLHIRMPPEELEAAKYAAEKARMGFSEWVREAIRRFL